MLLCKACFGSCDDGGRYDSMDSIGLVLLLAVMARRSCSYESVGRRASTLMKEL